MPKWRRQAPALALLLACGSAAAEPEGPWPPRIESVWGGGVDGSAATLLGEHFGPHGLQVEWLGGPKGAIERLAPGAAPEAFGAGWRIGVASDATPSRISDGRAHSGKQSIRSWVDHDVDGSWNSGYIYEPGHEFDEIYVTWWTWFDPISDDGTCTSYGPQWKMWRLNATASYNASFNNFLGEIMSSGNYRVGGARDNLYTMNWCAPVENGCCDGMRCDPVKEPCFPWGYPNGTSEEQWHYPPFHPQPMPEDARRWVRWEVYVKASSANEIKDGSYVYRLVIPGQPVWEVDWSGRFGTHRKLAETPGVSTWLGWTRFAWQNYWGNCGDDAEWYIDDIYVQLGTRARVELGDAARWEDCTHTEIQPISSWTEESISVALNTGSFQPGDLVYFYVHDASGRFNPAGMPHSIREPQVPKGVDGGR